MTATVANGLSLLAATKSTSSGSSSFLLILVVIGAAFYFFLYRPQQQKAKRQRELQNQFEVGDEVLTAGGLVGHVLDIDGDRITLETSVGASFVVLRQYVVRRLEAAAVSAEEGEDGGYYGEDEPGETDGVDGVDGNGVDGVDGNGVDAADGADEADGALDGDDEERGGTDGDARPAGSA
ncbi:MAG: preprotein translocase subunit YajC [Acidimicrobiales bacterium]